MLLLLSLPVVAKSKHVVPDSLQRLEINVQGVTISMQRVEGGSFMMGSTIEQSDRDIYTDKPAHLVFLSPYYIATTEVTNALWRVVMPEKETLAPKGYPTNPVSYISWHDAQEFVRRLDSITGLPFRLPTEAEWEYAARGGAKSERFRFAGDMIADSVGWLYPYAGNWSHPVARKRPNELGLYDMTGNVSEWCQDRFGAYTLNTMPDPCGPDTGSYRVARGGSYDNCVANSHISVRYWYTPETTAGYIGLRVALTLPNDPMMQPIEEEPPLTKTIRVKGRKLKFYYVPAEQPYYISDELSTSTWEKYRDLYWQQEASKATQVEVAKAIHLGVIVPPKPKQKRWERDVRSIQQHRKTNKRATAFTELFGVKLKEVDDPVLQQYQTEQSDKKTVRLAIRVR